MDALIETARKVRARPTRAQAEEAVRTLLAWTGDNPDREGLVGTPDRVVRAYEEFFEGYQDDPVALLERTFEETGNYNEMVVLRDIRLESHCEHHIIPLIGKAHVAYLPTGGWLASASWRVSWTSSPIAFRFRKN